MTRFQLADRLPIAIHPLLRIGSAAVGLIRGNMRNGQQKEEWYRRDLIFIDREDTMDNLLSWVAYVVILVAGLGVLGIGWL